MKNRFSKTALLMTAAFAFSVSAFAQEQKYKVEEDGYEMKMKQEKNEFKMKEKGRRPMRRAMEDNERTMEFRRGATTTTVRHGAVPQQDLTAKKESSMTHAGKKTYASRKNCTCKSVAAKKRPMHKRNLAYRHKSRSTMAHRSTAVATRTLPVVVRDTVYITRVDTVFSMNESSSYAGYRSGYLRNDVKKMKIKRDGDEIILKKEYEDGQKVKQSFDSEEDLNTYLRWREDY